MIVKQILPKVLNCSSVWGGVCFLSIRLTIGSSTVTIRSYHVDVYHLTSNTDSKNIITMLQNWKYKIEWLLIVENGTLKIVLSIFMSGVSIGFDIFFCSGSSSNLDFHSIYFTAWLYIFWYSSELDIFGAGVTSNWVQCHDLWKLVTVNDLCFKMLLKWS